MKRIFFMSLVSLIAFTGCSSEENELLSAIDNSYDLNTGSIVSNFDYTTEYNNIDIAGTVDGQVKILFGSDYDKIAANVNFEDKKEVIEYYVDKKGDIITENTDSDVVYAPLYIEAPELDEYAEQVPEPTAAEINVDGAKVKVNKYSFKFEKLNTEVAKSMFDPIVKLGFVSTDVLQSELIEGTFNLNYFVDPETGNLVKETLSFTNEANNSIATKTKIEVANTYNYDETEVELPAGYGEAKSEATSEVEAA